MIQIEFSAEEIDALEYERYNYPHPKVQRRMEAVYLKSQGLSHQEIQRLCRIRSKTTLASHLKAYQTGGIDQLKQLGYQGPSSELCDHAARLEEAFREQPPRSSGEAQARIEQLTGLKRSPTQIRTFMKGLGLGYRKVGYVPGQADDPKKQAEQETFKTEQLAACRREKIYRINFGFCSFFDTKPGIFATKIAFVSILTNNFRCKSGSPTGC